MMNGQNHKKNGNEIPSFNYIRLINWTWEHLPFIAGCKSSHIALFLAIVDSINKNQWRRSTPIPYEVLVQKSKLSKETYLAARAWLICHGIIEVEIGRNAYQMARFDFGAAVGNTTGNQTGDPDSTHLLQVENPTGNPTHYKTENNTKQETLNVQFDRFWDTYGKKRGKEKCAKLWTSLTDSERLTVMAHLPNYVQSTPEIQYRKDPERYLKHKCFNDEIIRQRGQTNQLSVVSAGERESF